MCSSLLLLHYQLYCYSQEGPQGFFTTTKSRILQVSDCCKVFLMLSLPTLGKQIYVPGHIHNIIVTNISTCCWRDKRAGISGDHRESMLSADSHFFAPMFHPISELVKTGFSMAKCDFMQTRCSLHGFYFLSLCTTVYCMLPP